ncbi:MAG TPA: peptide chain release factor N(5)-glutamine methyltransferase [Blastocatellia bacterium]|jgi:release factor glutamine methyltransferase|nr:peptide chain release factor N(5)-glutamine methyltransferase [Blastocatellia bacterium]
MPTIAEAIAEGAQRLRASGVGEERRAAGALLCHALGIDRTRLLTRPGEQVDAASYEAYLASVARRAAGEPLQYITGRQEFYSLDFIVTPDVLIPRPETEFLIERVIGLNRARHSEAPPVIVDVGTGSGCIAVTLAHHIPDARVIAIDVSSAALDVARANAELHGVRSRIEFVEGDLLEPLEKFARGQQGLKGEIDFLASNPPYVEEEKPEAVQPEVRGWEPALALYGGADGLNYYRRLLAEGAGYLKPGGHLVCEIGYCQLEAIRKMIDVTKWELVDVTHDLQGIPRTLSIKKI